MVIKITLYRVTFIISMFTSFLLLLVTMCGWLAYKIETYDEEEIQISLWSVCTFGEQTKAYDCANGWLDNYYDTNPEVWFNVFRGFFTFALVLQFCSVVYTIAVITFAKNATDRRLWLPGIMQFCAAILLLLVQMLFHLYIQFDFLTEFRETGLGWTDETSYEEFTSEGYSCTWASFVLCLINSILSIFICRYETYFRKNFTFLRQNESDTPFRS